MADMHIPLRSLAASPDAWAEADGALARPGEACAARNIVAMLSRDLDAAETEADLDAIAVRRPMAVALRHWRRGADVQRLGVRLAVREARFGWAVGSVGVIACIGSSPEALLRIETLIGCSRRLVALMFGEPGTALARERTRLAAAAAGVPVIHFPTGAAVHARDEALALRAQGFGGRVAYTAGEALEYNAAFAVRVEDLRSES